MNKILIERIRVMIVIILILIDIFETLIGSMTNVELNPIYNPLIKLFILCIFIITYLLLDRLIDKKYYCTISAIINLLIIVYAMIDIWNVIILLTR